MCVCVCASCMTILGERTEQLDIFCRVTGFTSDFLSFIDVELIRFFHVSLQLVTLALLQFRTFTLYMCPLLWCDQLTNGLPDVCDELIADVKEI